MNTLQTVPFNPTKLRADFPVLSQRIHRDKPIIYFDNGASTQRPMSVVSTMTACYESTYSNVHRGLHWLSEQASAQYEQARAKVRGFINAADEHEVIFTSGTTLGINVVARAWGDDNIEAGDEILLTIFEHHSNIVPWQQLAERKQAQVKFVGITQDGQLDLEDFQNKLSERTKIVAFSAVSNVLGTQVPVKMIVEMAQKVGAATLVDAAQHVPHEKTNVQDWNADFVVFSGHKMLGPTGVGVLWGKRKRLEMMSPFLGGGSMIDQVTTQGFTPGELPAKFEAGTPPIVEAIGLGAAIDYLNQLDLNTVAQHEHRLTESLFSELESIDGLRILGPSMNQRSGLVSFLVDGASPQDIAILLDQQGVAIRAGHHCAMPLHQYLDVKASCRASFYLYNTLEEVAEFGQALKKVLAKIR